MTFLSLLRVNASTALRNSTHGKLLTGFLLALLWSLFAYRHLLAFAGTREWAYLLIGLSETLTAIMFIVRAAPQTISSDRLDWLAAILGTFSPFFFIPGPWGLVPAAKHAIGIGVLMQIFGMCSLNRSFGLVAAKREIKTRGMYRLVRHPLYASYLLIFTAYLLANTTVNNGIVWTVAIASLFFRMLREERHLRSDPAYCKYMAKVRYRVIPLMF